MKESFTGKKESEQPRQMNRRGFLGLFSGAVSSAALSAIPAVSLLREKSETKQATYDGEEIEKLLRQEEIEHTLYDKQKSEELSRQEEKFRSFEGVSNSRFFITQIVEQSNRYERELPVVLEFAKTVTSNDPEGRNRITYLQQMLQAKGVPEAAMNEIRKQVVGIAFEESRYDAERESGEKARGILQIIPSTWNDLSKEGENVLSLVDQTRVAGELLAQTCSYLENTVGDELQTIEAEFFHGNKDEFDKCFLAPVLINAYNAGMGTMAKLISWFARTYGTQEKTVELFGQKEMLSGYDVFTAMAKRGLEEKPVHIYKEDASAYTFKVYGAALCLLSHPSTEDVLA